MAKQQFISCSQAAFSEVVHCHLENQRIQRRLRDLIVDHAATHLQLKKLEDPTDPITTTCFGLLLWSQWTSAQKSPRICVTKQKRPKKRAARQPHIWRIPKMEVPENHPFLFGGVHYKPSNLWYLDVSGVHLQGCSRKGLPEQRGSKELWSGRTVRCTRGYQGLQNPMMWVLTSVSSPLGLFWKLLAITWLLKLDAYYSTITTSPWFSVNTCTSGIWTASCFIRKFSRFGFDLVLDQLGLGMRNKMK